MYYNRTQHPCFFIFENYKMNENRKPLTYIYIVPFSNTIFSIIIYSTPDGMKWEVVYTLLLDLEQSQ